MNAKDDILRVYHEECLQLLQEFKIVRLKYIHKIHNSEANRLAQGASGYRPILTVELSAEDWRKEIIDYLKNPSKKVYKQLRYKAIKYVLLEMSCIIVPLMEFCSNVSVKRKLKF
jgi:hypothetical protein